MGCLPQKNWVTRDFQKENKEPPVFLVGLQGNKRGLYKQIVNSVKANRLGSVSGGFSSSNNMPFYGSFDTKGPV